MIGHYETVGSTKRHIYPDVIPALYPSWWSSGWQRAMNGCATHVGTQDRLNRWRIAIRRP